MKIVDFIIAILKLIFFKRPRGKLLEFEKLKDMHIMYICVHKDCGKPCYYARPHHISNYKSPEKIRLMNKDGVLITDKRIWLDGYIPSSKTTKCFNCDKKLDYMGTDEFIYRVPATKENYEKHIKPLDISL